MAVTDKNAAKRPKILAYEPTKWPNKPEVELKSRAKSNF